MNSLSRIIRHEPLENVISNIEREIAQIESQIPKDEPFEIFDDSVIGCLRLKEKTYRAAIDKIRQYSGSVDVYNEEHASDLILNSLLEELKEIYVFSDCANNTTINADLERLEVLLIDVGEINKSKCEDEDFLLKLKRTQITAKTDLEYVLDTFYPELKVAIKEILSTLEAASKKARNESENYAEFNEPYLMPALEQLTIAGIIEEIDAPKYKLACLT